jgi:23S rRNA pseudouridine955/2504/2580 synthase
MKFEVEDNYIGTRLDKYIRKKYKLDMNEIFKLVNNGKIQVNFKKERNNYRIKENDIIYIKDSVQLEEKEFFLVKEEEKNKIQSSIMYENNNLIFYNKDENVVMHKGSGHEFGLSEMLKSYYKNMDFTFVNRIDRETSGLIIGSKNLDFTRKISEMIAGGEVIKRYFVLVEGEIQEDFQVKSYLLKKGNKVEEYKQRVEGSKESISYFKVLKNNDKYTLLEATLGTGRTHQLRVQLSKRGHAIVGDKKYGSGIETQMHLFSHRITIEKYGIDINLNVPSWFLYY